MVFPILDDHGLEVIRKSGEEIVPGDNTGYRLRTSGAVTGTVNISAPTGPFAITLATIPDTATDPLPSPLTGRVDLSFRNESLDTDIYFGNSNVTADNTATGGWKIGPGEDFHIALKHTQVFYLIAPTGESALVRILEIASV